MFSWWEEEDSSRDWMWTSERTGDTLPLSNHWRLCLYLSLYPTVFLSLPDFHVFFLSVSVFGPVFSLSRRYFLFSLLLTSQKKRSNSVEGHVWSRTLCLRRSSVVRGGLTSPRPVKPPSQLVEKKTVIMVDRGQTHTYWQNTVLWFLSSCGSPLGHTEEGWNYLAC